MTPCALPRNSRTRISSDAAWPLRNAEGLTFAQTKQHRSETARTTSPGVGAVAGGE